MKEIKKHNDKFEREVIKLTKNNNKNKSAIAQDLGIK